MPSFTTSSFGTVCYQQESVVEFPAGLPGFEAKRKFLALHFADLEPLLFLQSLEEPGLCFITLPVLAVAPRYSLQVSSEDLAQVDLPTSAQPRIGKDVLCLTIITVREEGLTANLLAPIVVNLSNLKAVQAIAEDSGYSHEHVLPATEMAACS